ncbi:hypothetical protein JFN87_29425, partial [Streptomyces bomunensis]|nr:hypothetical protein [Streptomyces montanisoli]
MSRTARGVTRAALIGAATGLRSTWGPAALSWTATRHDIPPSATALLVRRPAGVATLAAAVAECAADKSPVIPSRLSASGLVPRLVLGAATGAAFAGRGRTAALP